MEQKMVTGGINMTSTPILKYLRNRALFDPLSAARHIEHCASAGTANNNNAAATRPTINIVCKLRKRIYSSTGAGATGGCSLY